MFWIILITIVLLFFVLLIRRKFTNEKLILATHSLLYLLEILIVTSFIVNFLFQKVDFFIFEGFLQLEILRDYVFAYTLYQLFLLMTFKLKDSIDVDANTAVKIMVDKLQLYGEFDKDVPSDVLDGYNEAIKTVFFNEDQQKLTETIHHLASGYNDKTISKEDYRMALKSISLDLDMSIKISSYGWMQSILLRIFK